MEYLKFVNYRGEDKCAAGIVGLFVNIINVLLMSAILIPKLCRNKTWKPILIAADHTAIPTTPKSSRKSSAFLWTSSLSTELRCRRATSLMRISL